MATINNDFKVKNGLVVGTTATITNNATIGGDLSVTGNALVQGVDLLKYDPHVWFVSDDGSDTSGDGRRIQSAFSTLGKALSLADSGDTVYIEAGIYYENFPFTIPRGVSVRGAGLREVTVRPTTATNTQSAFLLNGETTISDFTVGGFYKPGFAFRFAPGAKVTTRSPYIERFSVITNGSATSSGDPYGFDAADAGGGAYLDASVLDPTSLEPAMLWNEATFIVPNATGFYMTNGARAELLNGFTYFADKSIVAEAGALGYGGVGKTKLRLSGISGTFTAGDTITYLSPTGTTLASGTIASADNGYVYLSGPVWGFSTVFDRSAKSAIAYSSAVTSTSDKKFGSSSLLCTGNATDLVEVLSDVDFQFGSGNYTIEAWINPISFTGNTIETIVSKGTTNSDAFRMYLSKSGSNYYLTARHGNTVATGSTVISSGVWTNITVVHSGTNLKVYINGLLDGSATGASDNVNNTDPLNIGSDGTNNFVGYIDELRISNVARYSGTFTASSTGLHSDPSTVLMLHFEGANNGTIIVDDPIATQNVYSTGAHPASATRIELADYHQFGAELRCIGSAAVFGNSGVTASGTGTDLKLIAFNLSHIGSGKDLSCDGSLAVQQNEIIQTNGGIIYYQTVDHNGDFRVGDSFLVNQRTGNVSFGNAQVNLSNLNSLIITDGVNNTTILPTGISAGDIVLSSNTIGTLSGDLNLNPAGAITVINSNLEVDGSAIVHGTAQSISTTTGALIVAGGIGMGGDLHVGGTMYGAFNGALQGTATTATNIYAGSAGQIPYQTGFSQTTFIGPGTAGEVLVRRGTSGPVFQNTLTLAGSLYNTGTSTSSNALYVVGGIGAGWMNLANEGWINGAQIVTTATLGNSFGSGGVPNAINITNTGSNAFTVVGGAVIGGNLLIGGNVQFNGTVTSINSNAVDIGSKIVYLSTLSNTALQAFGSGFIIGSDPENSSVTNTWASLTFDGGTPGNWVMGNGLWPGSNNLYNLGDSTYKWATAYVNTLTASVVNGTAIYDNGNRVLTSESPTAGAGIGITSLVTSGPSASFTINNLGVTSATGSTYIGVSASTGSITITNLGVQSLTGSTYMQVSNSTGTVTLTNTGVTNLSSGSDITLSATTGSITINDVSTLQSVTNRGATSNNAITITNATASTGTTTGALTVTGGVGIQGSVYAGNIYSNGNQVLTSGGAGSGYVSSIIGGTDISVNTATGAVTISDTSTLQSVTGRGATTTNAVKITNTTTSVDTTSGALVVTGGVGIGGAVHIANTSYIGTGTILTSVDLQTVTYKATYLTNDPTSISGLVAVAGTSTIYGTYNFGTVTDVQTFNDYNTGTNTGFYSINDAATSPGAITYIGFTGVTDFNRFVLNINYTSSSGHTQDIDLYNWVTQAWDTFTTYSGSTNWFQFIEGVIDPAPYISSGKVWARIYHASTGNVVHRTWIDYAALEKSIQGGQGPRGATGATGPTGPQGLTTTTTSTFIFSNTTNSTSTNSGAVVAYGGVGIGKDLYIGGSAYISGSQVLTTATGVSSITAGTDTRVSSSTGPVTIWDESTLQTVTGRGASSNNAISLTSTLGVTGQTTLGAVTATSLVVNGTVQHNGLVLTNGLNIDQVYSTSTTITLSTNWQDTDVDAAELATGSYMVQCTANDSGVGGNEVNTYYTGIMSWYSGGDTENSYDEITLHRAGAASGSGNIFLQVLRTSGGFMKLQIAGTTNNSGPSTYTLKFRRMI